MPVVWHASGCQSANVAARSKACLSISALLGAQVCRLNHNGTFPEMPASALLLDAACIHNHGRGACMRVLEAKACCVVLGACSTAVKCSCRCCAHPSLQHAAILNNSGHTDYLPEHPSQRSEASRQPRQLHEICLLGVRIASPGPPGADPHAQAPCLRSGWLHGTHLA